MNFTHHDIIIICSLILGATFLLYQVILLFSIKKIIQKTDLYHYLALTISILLSTCMSLLFFIIDIPEPWKKLGFDFAFVFGFLGFAIYTMLLEQIFNLKSKYTHLFKTFFKILVVFFTLVTVIDSFSSSAIFLEHGNTLTNNHYLQRAAGGWHPNPLGTIIFAISSFSILAYVIYLFIAFYQKLRSEPLLSIGLVMTVVVLINDILMGTGKFPHLFPIIYIGFLFEMIRIFTYFNKQQFNYSLSIRKQYFDLVNQVELTLIKRSIKHDLTGMQRVLNKHLPNLQEQDSKEIKRRLTNINTMLSSTTLQLDNSENINCSELVRKIIELEVPPKYHSCFNINIAPELTIHSGKVFLHIALRELIKNSLDQLKLKNENEHNIIQIIMSDDREFFYLDPNSNLKPQDLAKIFSNDFSTKGEGRGLGMGICRDALFHLGASISAQLLPDALRFKIKFFKSVKSK